jgi:serine/threonine-protein kinase
LSALRADPSELRRRWLRLVFWVVAGAAVVAAMVAGSLALRARRAAAEQARVAQQFGQEVERIGAISRYSALLPLHDTREESAAIRAHMQRLEERMRAHGALAGGPGHEALGRGYLALEQYDHALRELEVARATGYRSAELAYALGMAHGKLYERALAELQKTNDEKLDAARREAIVRAHRDPALGYLKEAEAYEGQSVGGIDAPEYVEGLIALYEQRFDDALALARKAAGRVLWRYEGSTLEGDIHLTASKERYLNGDIDGAIVELDGAGVAYRRATDVARSGAAAYLGDCRRLEEAIAIQIRRSLSPEANLKSTISSCSAAATTRPDDATPLVALGAAWKSLASYQERKGADPTAASDEAIRLANRALALDERSARAHWVIAEVDYWLGSYSNNRGIDPRKHLEGAIEHARQAIRIDPNLMDAYVVGSKADWALGHYQGTHGEDPRASYQAAIELARLATALTPRNFLGWNELGLSEMYLGVWQMVHGRDPTETFTRAIAAYEKVTQIVPTLPHGYNNECLAYPAWGKFEARRGRDPRTRFQQAIAACRQAIHLIEGRWDGGHDNLGMALIALAHWQLEHGLDPSSALGEGRTELRRGLAIDPNYPEALAAECEAGTLEARWALARGSDPTPAFAAAEAAGKRAVAITVERSAEILNTLAELYRQRAEWHAKRGGGVAADVRSGLDLTARALEQDPHLAIAAATQGALHFVSARATKKLSERMAAANRARIALEKAIAEDANLEPDFGPLHAEATALTAE